MTEQPPNQTGHTSLRRIATAGIAAAALLFGAGSALGAGGEFSDLAERLADLRSEVDELTSEVETKKNRLQSRLRSIQRQKADIERKIEKQKMRVQRFEKSLEEHREEVAAKRQTAEKLQPAVLKVIDRLRESVHSGPPFKKSKRLKQLDDLGKQMKDGMRTPQKTVSRLWQFVEDELRLGREMGVYSQVIEIDGEEVLAEVARLGMVALYFKTDQGRVGVATRTDDGWSWQPVESGKGREHIEKLFDSFQKNIRVGYFEFPCGFDGIRRLDEEGT